jgi:hypothetical protein
MIWVQGRSSMGLIMLRNTICGILWDTFLKQHKLAMGGALRTQIIRLENLGRAVRDDLARLLNRRFPMKSAGNRPDKAMARSRTLESGSSLAMPATREASVNRPIRSISHHVKGQIERKQIDRT